MSNTVISVEDVGKLYRLGQIGTGTLKHDLSRWWAKIQGKEDPLSKIDEANDRTVRSKHDYSWALKNINFELQQGNVLGIIGNNGAGKSTLLKILSEITTPTEGRIKIKGQIASLLEVGTGFHPELTGRENVFLNGAILGMKKKEIKAKFDEIVDFAGVERYIDTPVKRYSSGMYVRLAFAVAAHLEPEILIVDEVLAVGDGDFQKKCLGKMQDVSRKDGRTILFVSHNMQAIKSLCNEAIWLHQGRIKERGSVSHVINEYLSNTKRTINGQSWENIKEAPGNELIRFKSVELVPDKKHPNDPLDIRVPLTIKFKFWNLMDNASVGVGLHLFKLSGSCVFDVPSHKIKCHKGLIEGECTIPGNFLNNGPHYISLAVVGEAKLFYYFEHCLSFDLEDYRGDNKWFGEWWGAVRPQLPFQIEQTLVAQSV